jgi:hypothetical protein
MKSRNKRTPESLNQALEAFTQAIAHDPNYSDAYVGLADCYNLLREFSAMPGNEAYFASPKFLVLELVGAMLKAVADDSLSFRYTRQLLRGAVTAPPCGRSEGESQCELPFAKGCR